MLQYKPYGEAVTVVIAGELDHFAAPQIRRMLEAVGHSVGIHLPEKGHATVDLPDLKSALLHLLTL